MTKRNLGLLFGLMGCAGLIGCTSDVVTNLSPEQMKSIEEIAALTKVDAEELALAVQKEMEEAATSSVDPAVDKQVRACIADRMRDGSINLSDIGSLADQIGKTCHEVALAALADPRIPDDVRCMNLSLDREGLVNLSDISVFATLFNDSSLVYDPAKCTDPFFGDWDWLSVDQELVAYVNLDPLSGDSDGDGMSDLEEFGRIIWPPPLPTPTPPAGVVIESVSSQTVSQGQSLVLTGSGFGMKAQAAPVILDDLETGSFNPAWSATGYPGVLNINTDNQRHPFSHFNTMTNFVGSQEVSNAAFSGGSNSPQWFVQYWFKLGNDWNWGDAGYDHPGANLANVKLFRMWETGSSRENFVLAAHGWMNAVIVGTEYIGEANEPFAYIENNYMQNWTRGEWHLFQFEFKDSSIGVHDGLFRWWIDGALAFENTEIMTRLNDAPYKRPFGVGFFNSSGDASTDDNHFYMDDAYIDNTFARVELGDHPLYDQCTHREIQIATAWSDGSVTFTANRGSLPAGTAYLFVVNADGERSLGKPLTVQ